MTEAALRTRSEITASHEQMVEDLHVTRDLLCAKIDLLCVIRDLPLQLIFHIPLRVLLILLLLLLLLLRTRSEVTACHKQIEDLKTQVIIGLF